MRDRAGQILRLVCLSLAVLLLAQLIRAGFRVNPLSGAKIPPVPTLETNVVPTTSTMASMKIPATNAVKAVLAATNSSAAKTNSSVSTNTQIMLVAGTNLVPTNVMMAGTANALADAGTNAPAKKAKKSKRVSAGEMMAGGMSFDGVPMMPGMASGPKLPPEIQARVDVIVNSEIFAPVMRPLPAGLLGIAGDTAFLRAASGQTGLVKVGESVGELKLLRIGINRVLVEQNGQKNELMIFDGYGGDSLLQNETPSK